MKYLSILTIIGAITFACSNEPQYTAAEIAEGKPVYTKYCVACHGADGKLQLNGAKDFQESEFSFDERVAIIRDGRNLMTPFKEILNEEEIKAVAAYTMKLSKSEQ